MKASEIRELEVFLKGISEAENTEEYINAFFDDLSGKGYVPKWDWSIGLCKMGMIKADKNNNIFRLIKQPSELHFNIVDIIEAVDNARAIEEDIPCIIKYRLKLDERNKRILELRAIEHTKKLSSKFKTISDKELASELKRRGYSGSVEFNKSLKI